MLTLGFTELFGSTPPALTVLPSLLLSLLVPLEVALLVSPVRLLPSLAATSLLSSIAMSPVALAPLGTVLLSPAPLHPGNSVLHPVSDATVVWLPFLWSPLFAEVLASTFAELLRTARLVSTTAPALPSLLSPDLVPRLLSQRERLLIALQPSLVALFPSPVSTTAIGIVRHRRG